MEKKTEIKTDEMPDTVDGYQVSEKVAIGDLLSKDADDESLNRYKQSLLKTTECPFPEDERNLIVESLIVQCEGRDPVSFDPNTNGFTFVMKEGVEYNIKLSFYVQRDIVSCLKYMNFVSKMGVRVDKSQTNVGSYGPSKDMVQVMIEEGVTPSGLLGRGKYKAKARLIDDDMNVYLEVEYKFEIKKSWE